MAVTERHLNVGTDGGIPIPYVAHVSSSGAAVSPATEDKQDTIITAVQKGGLANSVTPAFAEQSNATIRVDGTSVGAVPLVASSTPYIQATVVARKPVSGATKASIANQGTVWICGSATVITGAFPLAPGESFPLPDNCDLADFSLAVETAYDGVSIVYTV